SLSEAKASVKGDSRYPNFVRYSCRRLTSSPLSPGFKREVCGTKLLLAVSLLSRAIFVFFFAIRLSSSASMSSANEPTMELIYGMGGRQPFYRDEGSWGSSV